MGTDTQETVNNYLVPKMEKATSEEIEKLSKTYNITAAQLPHIKMTDAGLTGIAVGAGDVVKIHRKSWLTGEETLYYRQVVD
ncbi:DNA-directed RNA polymerase subunit H [Candidatus Micrarchaeota archaeon]|nr:DNA-directed RNA polymerase subunit H [Candidatus Micrarchaeota archaeon]